MTCSGDLPLVRQASWADQPGYTNIFDIRRLGVDEDAALYESRKGRIAKASTGDGVRTLISDGFGKCAALLLRNAVVGNEAWYMAHARILDEALYNAVERCPDQIDEACFVFGSVSAPQGDIEDLLISRGVMVRSLYAETGGAHFGVAFDILSREVTIVRRTPDKSLLTYRPFV